ncbi:SDR family NAD(P)-dependent oxidoreductase [Halobacteriovorax sp.]|uniref:SDR family NAD(P)-dependent oxidoreductase n=1 Tax=Halobacteriovorax sp. TaxID=2020862 RepID=UPI003AF2E1A4
MKKNHLVTWESGIMTKNKKFALITGATTGMGEAFANYFASAGINLYLHGRNSEKLSANAKTYQDKYHIECKVIVKDLIEDDASSFLIKEVTTPINYLVNNAGYGVAGKYQNTDIEKQIAMQRVHVEVPMRLTHHFLKQDDQLQIINVASLYAFFPVPRQCIYAASKSMIHSFSLALYRDLIGTNKTVISVCPGLVYTQFRINQGKQEKKHFSGIWPKQVVEETLNALSKQSPFIIPGRFNRIFKSLLTTLPTKVSLRIIERVNTGRGY